MNDRVPSITSDLHHFGKGGLLTYLILLLFTYRFVYKTVKYHKDITNSLVEEQRKDSIVLERMSLSQFIPAIHGYCSLGVMMDFMPEGNMHNYIKGARRAGGSTLPPVDRLRLSM